MKRITKKYLASYDVKKKTTEELYADMRTLGILYDHPKITKKNREFIRTIGIKIRDEFLSRRKEYIKESFTDVFEVHSIDHMEMSKANPSWLELTGILFHRGIHKGVSYDDDVLKNARLVPREGERLCYVNFYHKKDEEFRVGILAEIWWDSTVAWYCPTNKIHGKGALMYRSFITDKDAIQQVLSKRIGNVSAELRFDTYIMQNDKSRMERAVHVLVTGKAITPSPALKAADIENVCTIDEEGNRSCTKTEQSKLK